MSIESWSDQEIIDELVELEGDSDVEIKNAWEYDFLDTFVSKAKLGNTAIKFSSKQRESALTILRKYRPEYADD